jgi:hypothetical protein
MIEMAFECRRTRGGTSRLWFRDLELAKECWRLSAPGVALTFVSAGCPDVIQVRSDARVRDGMQFRCIGFIYCRRVESLARALPDV